MSDPSSHEIGPSQRWAHLDRHSDGESRVGSRPDGHTPVVATAQALLDDLLTDAVRGARPWPAAGDTVFGLVPGGYGLRAVAVDADIAAAGERFLGALAR